MVMCINRPHQLPQSGLRFSHATSNLTLPGRQTALPASPTSAIRLGKVAIFEASARCKWLGMWGGGFERRCSADLPSFSFRFSVHNRMPACFSKRPRDSKTARSITIGAWSRTGAWMADARWCSGTCSIWARSTPANRRPGARRSKSSRPAHRSLAPWLCFRRNVLRTVDDEQIVRIRLDQLELRRPRQWGACWLASVLYQKLELDDFWSERLPPSRKGTRWDQVLQTLVSYRLIDPGSEWRLHREWFDKSAMADLLGADYRLAADDTLYRCLDQLLAHKAALFSHLQQRWKDLFAAQFDVLLYDLTSTYFESDPPFAEGDKRRFGYSRDKRFDCVQVVIALVVTPEGFPLGIRSASGKHAGQEDAAARRLASIEKQYGKARRVWVMDRGIPTEETLDANAPERSAGQLPGGHAQGTVEQTGSRAGGSALAAGPRGNHRQTAAAGRGMLRVCAERFAHRQGTGDATAPAQAAVEAACRSCAK